MGTNRKDSETKFLAKSGRSIDIALTHAVVKAGLADFGTTEEDTLKGKEIYDEAFTAFDQNRIEHNEESAAYRVYDEKFTKLEKMYQVDKKKANVVFKRDVNAKQVLEIDRKYPDAFDNQYSTIRTFYSRLNEDVDKLTAMTRFKCGADQVTIALALVDDVNESRKSYESEQAEAQVSTQRKNSALAALDIWMDDFLDVAEIAFMEEPQYLEMFGIVVK